MRLWDSITANRKHIYLLTRYGVSGIIGALIQIVSLYVWVSLLGFEHTYLLGLVLGFILALIATFLLQKYWAFKDTESKSIPHQLLYYSLVAVSGLALNALLLAGAKLLLTSYSVDFFHGWYLMVQTLITGLVAVFNFSLNYWITFSKARQERLWDR
jgi:putative flippase GtrA